MHLLVAPYCCTFSECADEYLVDLVNPAGQVYSAVDQNCREVSVPSSLIAPAYETHIYGLGITGSLHTHLDNTCGKATAVNCRRS